MRRLLALAVVALAVLAACGQPHQDLMDVRNALNKTDNSAFTYKYTDTDITTKRSVEVDVDSQDSFRTSATLSLNGTPLLDEMLVDDAVALRLRDPAQWNPAANTPLAPILGSGKWVVDPAGAPPVLFAGNQQDITKTGIDPLSDALNATQYVRAVMALGVNVIRFNKDSLDYRPDEDPFRKYVDDDIKAGLVRYDVVPPALPRTANASQPGRLPDARFFRRLSIYVKNGRMVRVLEVVDFEDQPDMLKAKREHKPKFLLQQLDQLRKGAGENPVRQRAMSIYVLGTGQNDVALPPGAIKANLGTLVSSGALARLPGAPVYQAPTTTIPSFGIPTPTPSPKSSSAPSPSASPRAAPRPPATPSARPSPAYSP